MSDGRLEPPVVLLAAYLTGALPLTNLAARRIGGTDLRSVGHGTVSGTGLYEVTGFGPLAAVGCLELAKGAVGPALAGRRRPALAALAAGAAVAGHNWSPFLGFAGGRGLAPGLGATLVVAPEGTALLGLGLGVGRLAGETALGCFAAIVALPAVLYATRRRTGLLAGVALAVPMLTKRLTGNARPSADVWPTLGWRLLLDRDKR